MIVVVPAAMTSLLIFAHSKIMGLGMQTAVNQLDEEARLEGRDCVRHACVCPNLQICAEALSTGEA